MKDFDPTLVHWFNPSEGPPPLPEHLAPLYEKLIELAPLKPSQRAAALQALNERQTGKNLDEIIYAKDWVELDPISCDEVPGYSALIARIQNKTTTPAGARTRHCAKGIEAA